MKILHIASFNGNIGDNANHSGFRSLFKKYVDKNAEFDNLEIRKFYFSWDEMKFDKEFAIMANQYDLVVIGGGNFFDITWPESSTGTTIDISQRILEQIKTPILFNALGLGYGIDKSFNNKAIANFEEFLDYICDSGRENKYFVSLRNDGAYENLQKLYGTKYNNKILEVPDNGFFVQTESYKHPELIENYKSIGVNVVCDGAEERFSNDLSYDDFIIEFSNIINDFLSENKEYQVIFFPHIYSDLKAINKIISNLDNKISRLRMKVAPYLSGQGSEKYIFNLYSKCELLLGMRFHANVGAISENVPSIGLATNHYRIPSMYNKLGIDERYLKVNEKNFSKKLYELIQKSLKEKEDISNSYKLVNDNLKSESEKYFYEVNKWLERFKIY